MNNLQQPAFPFINQEGNSLEDREVFKGFTKLEYASLLIAQGMYSTYAEREWMPDLIRDSVSIAKQIIEASNK